MNIYGYLASQIFQLFLIYFNTTKIIQDDLLISHMSIAGWNVNEQTLSNHLSSVFITAFIKLEKKVVKKDLSHHLLELMEHR